RPSRALRTTRLGHASLASLSSSSNSINLFCIVNALKVSSSSQIDSTGRELFLSFWIAYLEQQHLALSESMLGIEEQRHRHLAAARLNAHALGFASED